MAVTSRVVARFGFQPTFCHFDTYTRSAKFDYERLEYRPVDGAESLQWRPGLAGEKRKEGTPEAKLASTEFTKVIADRPVPDQQRAGSKRTGTRPGHWIYIFAAKSGGKQAHWYAELFALDESSTALNPKTTRAERLSWAPPDASANKEGESDESPPANVNYGLNGRDTFITAIGVPYRLSDDCLDLLEAELLELGDFVHVSKQLRALANEDGSKSTLQWLEIPVLHPWAVAENLANGIREARSRHSRRNGMPGENPAGFSKPPLEPKQAETESCKQYALMSALVALMKGSADLEKEISKRFTTQGPELLAAKRALKTRPYEQLRFHVEAELLGADLAGWLSRRLVRILMDGYIIPPGPTSTPEIEGLLQSLALASVALKHTSTGLEFLRILRSNDWRGTLLGAIAAPSDPSMQEQHEQIRPYVNAVLAIGTVALCARILLEGPHSFSVVSELEGLFELTFEGNWKDSLEVREKIISHFAFWGAGFDPKPEASHVLVKARRLQLRADTTARLKLLSSVAKAAVKVLDAINLAIALRDLHDISESNPKLRNGVSPKKWTPGLCGLSGLRLVLSLHRLEGDGAEVAERRVAAA